MYFKKNENANENEIVYKSILNGEIEKYTHITPINIQQNKYVDRQKYLWKFNRERVVCDICYMFDITKTNLSRHRKNTKICIPNKYLEEYRINWEKNIKVVNESILNYKKSEKITELQIPFLKWLGGKREYAKKICSKFQFPKVVNNYNEIFLGGASILFYTIYMRNNGLIKINGQINAYDLNKALIYTYKNIRDKPENVILELENLKKEYINSKSREDQFYSFRQEYNKIDRCTCRGSGLFIFLNKTCFRGIYRENNQGDFNVPYGHYKNPEIFEASHIIKVSKLVQNVNFIHMDCFQSLDLVQKDDLNYIDPPYFKEFSSQFISYTKDKFTDDLQYKLFDKINYISQFSKIVVSNSDVDEVKSNLKYNIEIIKCRRAINSKNPDDSVNEVLIYN
jgi:DNA adenine methylase